MNSGAPYARHAARALAFPCVFVCSLAAAWWGLERGFSASLVVFGTSTAAALAITLLERLLPFQKEWSRNHGDVPTDLFYVVTSLFAAPRLFDILALTALLELASVLPFGGGIWPVALPWGVQLVLAVLVAELGGYWWHRLLHERPLLFRLHATHHSAPRLYWVNATRFHPFDNVILYGVQVFPLIIAGANESVLVGFTVWSLVHGFFQHGNVDVRLGPLNYLFSMAELHRWHHSRELEEANRNYGSNCILWDLIFGTFYWPKDRTPPSNVGLTDLPEFPQRVVPQLLSPFLWPTGRTASSPRRDLAE